MTVREVAQRLEISVSLAYRLLASGKIRCNRHGIGRGVIRVSEDQLIEYLASSEGGHQRLPPRPAPPRPRLKHLRL